MMMALIRKRTRIYSVHSGCDITLFANICSTYNKKLREEKSKYVFEVHANTDSREKYVAECLKVLYRFHPQGWQLCF